MRRESSACSTQSKACCFSSFLSGVDLAATAIRVTGLRVLAGEQEGMVRRAVLAPVGGGPARFICLGRQRFPPAEAWRPRSELLALRKYAQFERRESALTVTGALDSDRSDEDESRALSEPDAVKTEGMEVPHGTYGSCRCVSSLTLLGIVYFPWWALT